MQKPGVCSNCSLARFLEYLAYTDSFGRSRIPDYPCFKIGANSWRKRVQAATDAELEAAP